MLRSKLFIVLILIGFSVSLQAASKACFIKKDGKIVASDKPLKIKADYFAVIGANPPIDTFPLGRPPLTEPAKQAKFSKTIMISVELIINEVGKVISSCALMQAPYGLDRSTAKYFIENKKYKPATVDGNPVMVKLIIPVRFSP